MWSLALQTLSRQPSRHGCTRGSTRRGDPPVLTRRGVPRLIGALTTFVLVLGFASLPSSAVAAPALSCGSTVRTSVILRADLTNCPGPGLIVGTGGITIDLNGHLISGQPTTVSFQCVYEFDPEHPGDPDFITGSTCADCDSVGAPACDRAVDPNLGFVEDEPAANPGAAVDNTAGFDGVTVRGGNVANYQFSYHAVGASRFTVAAFDARPDLDRGPFGRGLVIEDSDTGVVRNVRGVDAINVSQSAFVQIGHPSLTGSDHNTLSFTQSGADLLDSNWNTIEFSTFSTFKDTVLSDSDHNTVRGGRTTQQIAEPIFLTSGSDFNLIEGNTISGTLDFAYGIVVRGGSNNIIRKNSISKAVVFDGFPNSGGIALCEANDNRVELNTISAMYIGIGVGNDSSCPSDQLSGNIIRSNTISGSRGSLEFSENTGDGITLSAGSTGTVLTGNVLTKNQRDGIRALSPSVTITGNVATLNGRRVIDAVLGAIDGGGNLARGNGATPQCTGVVCR